MSLAAAQGSLPLAARSADREASQDAAAAILEGRNEQQVAAITHGEGPLLIVAGAGTGKTDVITRRIAWLIASGRARPDQILALTFTDKAAAEMEARVDVLVPLGMVGAQISTFHAFCAALLREHAIELGLTPALRVESPAEILVFVREHLGGLGLERYLPLGRPNELLKSLLGLFDRARDEDVSPEAYRAFAETLAREAGHDPARRDRAEAERERARAYKAYLDLLLKHGRVDFGHQIALALEIVRRRDSLAREYQDRYRYILVDEFQDTNHVQFELVKRLGGPRPNLTVVGDDDQSIYRFRGAKVENLIGFLEAYPGAREILLTRNYRSGQRILDHAYRLVKHNGEERLEVLRRYDKRLIAARGIPGEVVHRRFATGSDEADWVAEEIAKKIALGSAPKDFAILARAHASLEPFAAALKLRGIRFHRTTTRGLYARPEIRLCLGMLRAIADPDDGGAVYHVLADPLFGTDPTDLQRLGAEARRRNRPLLRVVSNAAADPSREMAPASVEAIGRFLDLHRRLTELATRRPTREVLYEFATQSGFLAALTAEDSAESIEKVQNVSKLLSIIERIAPLLVDDRVDAFISHLDLLIEAGDDPAAAEVDVEEDAVHLLTAHNAKGLEFPVVYMVQLVDRRFPVQQRADVLPLPRELRRSAGDDAVDHVREERRLFYVGMTRAMDRLVLTYASDYGGPRPWKVSPFVAEALDRPATRIGAATVTPVEAIRRHAPPVEPAPAGPSPIPAGELLQLSHSQIADYVTCPFKYRYAHVMHWPLPKRPELMYGIAIHRALFVYFQHKLKRLPITVEDVLSAYEAAWSDEGFLTPEQETFTRERGEEILRRYVARAEADGDTPLAVEMRFSFRRGMNEVVGSFDRLDQRPGGVAIVDYKTTDIEDAAEATQRARQDANDGQLGLYALAYRETRGEAPAQVEIHFVRSGLVGSSPVLPMHFDRAIERIDNAAAGIRAADFTPRPDSRTCQACDYSLYCPHSAFKPRA